MKRIILAVAVAFVATTASAKAQLNVFACEPEWEALVQELGGGDVSTFVATTGLQDVHKIQARPSLIAKARAADLMVCTGGELEIGWLPMVVQQASNPKIQAGAPGMFEAASMVQLLDPPARLDRSDGDIHASGNPHIVTDPRYVLAIAKPLAERMAELDPAHADGYRSRYADFEARFGAAIAKWEVAAAPLRGVAIAVQHKNWIYLTGWLGLTEVVALEPKPGVPASAGYLADVLTILQGTPVRMVIRAGYEEARPSEFLFDKAAVPAVVLPYTVGGTPEATDLFSLYETTIQRLLAAANQS